MKGPNIRINGIGFCVLFVIASQLGYVHTCMHVDVEHLISISWYNFISNLVVRGLSISVYCLKQNKFLNFSWTLRDSYSLSHISKTSTTCFGLYGHPHVLTLFWCWNCSAHLILFLVLPHISAGVSVGERPLLLWVACVLLCKHNNIVSGYCINDTRCIVCLLVFCVCFLRFFVWAYFRIGLWSVDRARAQIIEHN
jgi:hypothetical protein